MGVVYKQGHAVPAADFRQARNIQDIAEVVRTCKVTMYAIQDAMTAAGFSGMASSFFSSRSAETAHVSRPPGFSE